MAMRRALRSAWAGMAASALAAAGCAEILGFEPADTGAGGTGAGMSTGGTGAGMSTGGTGAGTSDGGTGAGMSTGGTGGAVMCMDDGDCPAGNPPPCQTIKCVQGTCAPVPVDDDTTIPCYEGPDGTEGVGQCVGGQRTCIGGEPTGVCKGQNLPAEEDCSSTQDEDCNGISSCPGGVLQAAVFSASDKNTLTSVAFNLDDSIYVTGTYKAASTFFGCQLPAPPAGGVISFVAQLSPDFTCQWYTTVSTTGSTADLTSIFTAKDHIYVAGAVDSGIAGFSVTPKSGGSVGGMTSSVDALLLDLDYATGAVNQVHIAGGNAADHGYAVTGDQLQYLLVQGGPGTLTRLLPSPLNLGGYNGGPGGGGSDDIIVLALDPGGDFKWTAGFGGNAVDQPRALAVANGQLLVGGGTFGNITVGPSCVLPGNASYRAFLFALDANNGMQAVDGTCATWGGTGESGTAGIGVSGDGQIVATGYATGPCDVGCGPVTGGGVQHGFLRTSALDGTCQAGGAIDSSMYSTARRAMFYDGGIAVAGLFNGTLGPDTAASQDVFVQGRGAGLDTVLWQKKLGAPGIDTLNDAAISMDKKSIVVVGSCADGNFDVAGLCDSPGDGFIVRLSL